MNNDPSKSPPEPSADLETRRQELPAASSHVDFDILVVQGPDMGLRSRLDAASGKILVGTGPLCDLRISDRTVSRRHASLELAEHGLLATDLGSTNGTFVNEARIMAGYLDPRDRLRIGATVLEMTARAHPAEAARGPRSFGRMAAASARMLNVFALCRDLAPTDVPVVVEGETGTGKEVLGECIHEASRRAQQPFIVLDCRTTPRDQIEAYLFGEISRPDGTVRAGIFEMASGGTLLIDEPGDLDLEVQAKLLRALDKGTVVRLNDAAPVHFNARVIVATSHNLDKLVEEGKFREDLYFRLAGARIELPPLRRRREDIPLLTAEFWTELGGKGLLPAEFLERYEAYDWPGNVRELGLAVERFLALGEKASLIGTRTYRTSAPKSESVARETGGNGGGGGGGAGEDDVLKRVLAANLGYSEARHLMLEAFERAYLEKALADSGGNVAAAAAASGIARRHFQRIRARQR